LKFHCQIQLPFLNIPCAEVTDGSVVDAPCSGGWLVLKAMEEIAHIWRDWLAIF
jgi:hypothetical protein